MPPPLMPDVLTHLALSSAPLCPYSTKLDRAIHCLRNYQAHTLYTHIASCTLPPSLLRPRGAMRACTCTNCTRHEIWVVRQGTTFEPWHYYAEQPTLVEAFVCNLYVFKLHSTDLRGSWKFSRNEFFPREHNDYRILRTPIANRFVILSILSFVCCFVLLFVFVFPHFSLRTFVVGWVCAA